MRATRIVFDRCLRVAALPTAAAMAVALVAAGNIDSVGPPTATTLAPWLHLPAFVATLACCSSAVGCWPSFAQQRPGADWVQRLERGPLYGCGAAAAGAMLALALLLIAASISATLFLPVPHAHRTLPATSEPRLDGPRDRVSFDGTGSIGAELRLRPIAYLPAATPEPVTLQILADGIPLLAEPAVVQGSQQLVRVPLPARAVQNFELRRLAGNLPLLWPAGSVVLIEAAARSRLQNGLTAAGCYLLPAAVALALAILAAPVVGLPINLVLMFAALLLQTLGNLGPAAHGVAALLGGRWLPAEPLFRWCLPSLSTGTAAMILAMALRRQLRR